MPNTTPIGTTLYTYDEYRDPSESWNTLDENTMSRPRYSDVTSIAWSPDSKYIASTNKGGGSGVHVWEALTGQHISRGHAEHFSFTSAVSVAWSSDSKYIASVGTQYDVQVWEAMKGNDRYSYKRFYYKPEIGDLKSVAWSPISRCVAVGSYNGEVHIWEPFTGKTLLMHKVAGTLFSVAWSPDGRFVVSGNDKSVQVWEAATGYTKRTYETPTWPSGFTKVAWSPNGKYIASASDTKWIYVWEAATGKTLFIYQGIHRSIAWSPDSKYIVSGSGHGDSSVQIWDAMTGKIKYTYKGHTDRVNAVAWSPNGNYIASGGDDRTVRIWQAR